MKYALIGCGRVAYNHLKAATDNGFEIAAVCDIEPDHIFDLYNRMAFTPEQAGAIARYSDWNALFVNEKPELVSIALPSGLHARCAMDAVRQGIHVIVEKPIALSLTDADALIELAEKTGVKVSACHQNRFNLAVQEMRRYLEAGCFGVLSNAAVTVRWGRDKSYYASDDWRGTWAMDGGALMNQSIHGIDLLRWMCGGKLARVYGITKNRYHPYIQAEDVGAAVLEFNNGVIATLEGGVNVSGADMEEHLTLIGSSGAMKLGGTSANTVAYQLFANEGQAQKNRLVEQTANVYGNGHTSLFRDMAEAIETGRDPYVTARDGRDALETVLAVYLSSKTGQAVTLPLKDVKTADFEGMFDLC